MERFPKIIALVIVIALASGLASLGTQSLRVHALASERPSGCHEHGSQTPAPPSTSYQCCLTGHNIAVLQATQSEQPPFTIRSEFPVEPATSLLEDAGYIERTIASGAPPGVTPLRI